MSGYLSAITPLQKKLLLSFIALSFFDIAITTYGLFIFNGVFTEANPIYAAILAASPVAFVVSLFAIKGVCLLFLVGSTIYCNTYIGHKWGNAICADATLVPLVALIILSAVSIHNLMS